MSTRPEAGFAKHMMALSPVARPCAVLLAVLGCTGGDPSPGPILGAETPANTMQMPPVAGAAGIAQPVVAQPAIAQPVIAQPVITPGPPPVPATDGGAGDPSDPTDVEQEPADVAQVVTFAMIAEMVFAPRSCDSYLCHGADAGGLGWSDLDEAYADLVNVPATGLDCVDLGMLRVLPGEPEQSLLYLKLFDDAPCGEPMPPRSSRRLSDDEKARVRAWIEAGAPR